MTSVAPQGHLANRARHSNDLQKATFVYNVGAGLGHSPERGLSYSMYTSGLECFLVAMTAMVSTLLLVPPIKRLARVAGAMDEPNERKVHTGIIPRMGGLAMFFGCLITFLIYLEGFENFRGIFLGMVIMVVVGILDDSIGLEPRFKLLGQVVAASAAMFMSDLNINFLGGVVGTHYSLGLLSGPLTIFWIVGITNAINLSDGLDGLAGGISLIAFTCFGFLAYQRADFETFTLCLVLVGSILGFLRYNNHPAEIFMGDTGSLFLGYCLGTLSIAGNFKSVTAMTLITPVLVLLVPIADTLWAIIRRVRQGRSPFSADKMHFHHKLLNKGMNQAQTVSVLYAVCVALAIAAVALANSSNFKFVLVPILAISLALFLGQITGLVDVAGMARGASSRLDSWLPSHIQPLFAKMSLRLVQLGVVLYVINFMLGLPLVPGNLLFAVGITTFLVLYLAMTMSRSKAAESFMFFSFFFLAAVIVLATHYLQQNQSHMLAGLRYLEPIGFCLLVVGLFGKIIVKKPSEIFLSTPLEFVIFLILVFIAVIPHEIRDQYYLVPNTLRTFFLFLALKIIAMSWSARSQPATIPVV